MIGTAATPAGNPAWRRITMLRRINCALLTSCLFLVTAVSLWPGIRAVRKLDLATEVRERSQ